MTSFWGVQAAIYSNPNRLWRHSVHERAQNEFKVSLQGVKECRSVCLSYNLGCRFAYVLSLKRMEIVFKDPLDNQLYNCSKQMVIVWKVAKWTDDGHSVVETKWSPMGVGLFIYLTIYIAPVLWVALKTTTGCHGARSVRHPHSAHSWLMFSRTFSPTSRETTVTWVYNVPYLFISLWSGNFWQKIVTILRRMTRVWGVICLSKEKWMFAEIFL